MSKGTALRRSLSVQDAESTQTQSLLLASQLYRPRASTICRVFPSASKLSIAIIIFKRFSKTGPPLLNVAAALRSTPL